MKLNAQEVRNSAYPGPLNDLILDLSEERQFHSLLGIKDRAQSVIYQEMRDAEFVLRYLTFRDNWESFTSGIKRCMDQYMAENQRMSAKKLAAAKDDFLATCTAVRAAFGEYAFRRWVSEKQQWRRQVLASLYDAEMFACRGLSPERLKENQEAIIERAKHLFLDDDFRKSIDSATNATSSFQHRIRTMASLIKDTIGGGDRQ